MDDHLSQPFEETDDQDNRGEGQHLVAYDPGLKENTTRDLMLLLLFPYSCCRF